jgi:hypothetical protein
MMLQFDREGKLAAACGRPCTHLLRRRDLAFAWMMSAHVVGPSDKFSLNRKMDSPGPDHGFRLRQVSLHLVSGCEEH